MTIDDVLFDATGFIEEYLNDPAYQFDEETRADILWLTDRIEEMMAYLQAPPGSEPPHPSFRKRFGN